MFCLFWPREIYLFRLRDITRIQAPLTLLKISDQLEMVTSKEYKTSYKQFHFTKQRICFYCVGQVQPLSSFLWLLSWTSAFFLIVTEGGWCIKSTTTLLWFPRATLCCSKGQGFQDTGNVKKFVCIYIYIWREFMIS